MFTSKEIRHTKWKLSLFSLLFLFSVSVLAKDLRNCRVLYETLATGLVAQKSEKQAITFARTEKELEGLNFAGLVAWKPKEITDLNRKLVRYHSVEEFAAPIPAYDKTQKLGPAKVQINDLHFSQLGCQNGSEGGYTVINNAKSLKDGSLKVTDLPKLRVWRDVNGKIWTLDHRRLAAMKLSGAVDNLEVEFVAQDIVATQRFKFDTKSGGKSIMVRVESPGEEPYAIVVTDHQLKEEISEEMRRGQRIKGTGRGVLVKIQNDEKPEILVKLMSRFPATEKTVWEITRGEEHFRTLNLHSMQLANSFNVLTPYLGTSFIERFAEFGQISTRGKSVPSILAKLLRKDFEAFRKGQPGIRTLKEAVNAIGDAVGGRLILKTDKSGKIDPDLIQKVVNEISVEISKGTRVTEIMNYRARGPNGLPYFSDAQINQIVRADENYRAGLMKLQGAGKEVEIPEPIIVKSGPQASFETGYTSFQMNIKYPSGVQAEFQIKGQAMHEASEIQHFFYDLKAGKVLSESHAKDLYLVKASEKFNKLSPGLKVQAMKYVEDNLIHTRQIESGLATGPPPSLPTGLPEELSFKNLKPHLIHD